ncbi:MAG: RsmE family RNA methyltransferase [Rectinemataceae bacterium]
MNLILLEPDESGIPLPRSDRRHHHIARVLRKKAGDRVVAGRSDGRIGEALIVRLDDEAVVLEFLDRGEAPPLHPLGLILGFPRPIQAGRILKDLTSLGVENIWFALSELGEKSYAESDFFRKGEFAAHLREGAEQAGNPRIPCVCRFWSLAKALDRLDGLNEFDGLDEFEGPGTIASRPTVGSAIASTTSPAPRSPSRIYFHPAPGAPHFAELAPSGEPLWLAVGSERGWTDDECALLASRGFAVASLGDRILKSETAALAAVVLALEALGKI